MAGRCALGERLLPPGQLLRGILPQHVPPLGEKKRAPSDIHTTSSWRESRLSPHHMLASLNPPRRSTRSTWTRHAVAAAAGAMVLAACALVVVSTSNSGRSYLAEEAAAAGGGAAAPAAAAAAAAAAKVESGEGNPSQVASQIMADSLADHNRPYRTVNAGREP